MPDPVGNRSIYYSQSHLYRGTQKLEQKITAKIKNLIKTELGNKRLKAFTSLQLDFFKVAIKRIYYNLNRVTTYHDFNSLLVRLMLETSLDYEIHKLTQFDYSNGFIVITGHFGIAKATKITNQMLINTLATDINDVNWLKSLNTTPNSEPFPLRTAAIWVSLFKIFGKHKLAPHEVHMWYPFPFNKIQNDCKIAGIYLDRHGQYESLKNQFDFFKKQNPLKGNIPVFLIFPDLGTMGKRTGDLNPYKFDDFKIGFLDYAYHANIPILPIVQTIDQDAGFQVQILSPIRVSKEMVERNKQEIVDSIKKKMQDKINVLLKRNNAEV